MRFHSLNRPPVLRNSVGIILENYNAFLYSNVTSEEHVHNILPGSLHSIRFNNSAQKYIANVEF